MTTARTNTLLIRTPEGIRFSLLLAGPVTRSLAWGIDFICISVISLALGRALSFLAVISSDLAQGVYILALFFVSVGYGIYLEWVWRGQTLGKRLLRLRVMDAEGLRLRFSQIAIRNLLRFADMLPVLYLVGGVASLVSRKAQRLGDLAANTVVIRQPKTKEPDLDQLLAGKYNSLRGLPHLEARLRQRVAPSEATLALQAVLRREEFEPAARVALFEEIARHFRLKVEFPPEATEGIPDEQYVRNVVDVLFRPDRPESRGSRGTGGLG